MAGERTVLVTGATGRVGGQVVAQLAEVGGVRVRALSRDPAAASAALGPRVEVVGGDLTMPDTLAAALDGVDAVFLVFPSVAADGAARESVAMLSRRARRIVYLSAHGVPDEPDQRAEPDGGIIGSHAHLEGLIAASASEYTFLRASGFAANTLAWAGQIRRSDVLRWFSPDARRALVHEADLAAVGVRALTEDGHHRMAYHLTGPEQLTQVEQLAAIGDALNRSLRFEEIGAAEAGTELFPGLPGEVVAAIVAGHAAMVTHPEPVTDTVARLTGRPALPFTQWARDHIDDFTTPAG
ncbi:SDR family oxidoreductase [Nonomuraea maritima]|uniref:SDR family oxidoreductase n=1 Tax=Nonomuraea maritima TaxID=683260 RepID=UPI0037139984